MSIKVVIDRKYTLEARELYGKRKALSDLQETIKYHPEKEYLLTRIESDLEKIQVATDEWWSNISKVTNQEYSDEANIHFDISTIID
ncbi:CXXX repeat peptide modification system protein [[Clostridium] sordellii]|uniref:hypothetical protein n=1 Tax=Paraclostridium sordellii TaxID=1505 RepID=UPI0005DABEEA|nr:hypothetical protein [Paeniclostridium sordellii]CEN76370.1 CXXX repeat peptide modification system protein [[Clostridium] sordellii] [Paeniclostridium sordellii]